MEVTAILTATTQVKIKEMDAVVFQPITQLHLECLI